MKIKLVCPKCDGSTVMEHKCRKAETITLTIEPGPSPLGKVGVTCGQYAYVDHLRVECTAGKDHDGTHWGLLVRPGRDEAVQWGFRGPSVTL